MTEDILSMMTIHLPNEVHSYAFMAYCVSERTLGSRYYLARPPEAVFRFFKNCILLFTVQR